MSHITPEEAKRLVQIGIRRGWIRPPGHTPTVSALLARADAMWQRISYLRERHPMRCLTTELDREHLAPMGLVQIIGPMAGLHLTTLSDRGMEIGESELQAEVLQCTH